MNRLQKWVTMAVLTAASTTFGVSCSSDLLREIRDAAIAGTAGFVQTTTGTLLNQAIGQDG